MALEEGCRECFNEGVGAYTAETNPDINHVACKFLLHLDAATVKVRAETKREESIKARHEEEIKQKEADAVAAKKKHRAERSKIEKENTYINPVLTQLDGSKTTTRSSSSADDDDDTRGGGVYHLQ